MVSPTGASGTRATLIFRRTGVGAWRSRRARRAGRPRRSPARASRRRRARHRRAARGVKLESRSSPDVRIGVRVGQLGRVELRGERVLVDVGRCSARLEQPAGGLDELRPGRRSRRRSRARAARPRPSFRLQRGHLLPEPVRHAVAAADEAGATPCSPARAARARSSRRRSPPGPRPRRRPRPVLGREGVDGERVHPEVDRRLDGPPQGTRPPCGFDTGSPRRSAQRLPLSMMIATLRASSVDPGDEVWGSQRCRGRGNVQR